MNSRRAAAIINKNATLVAVVATGKKLTHDIVGYGPGHEPEFCRTCRHADHAEEPTCKYVQNIAPGGWCELFEG
jgi:hypothetical protein